MTIAAPKPKTYTAEEYLALEVESEVRSEFCDGAIVERTGGTPEHNEITSIFNALLRLALKGKPYSIFVTDQRLWVPGANCYTQILHLCRRDERKGRATKRKQDQWIFLPTPKR